MHTIRERHSFHEAEVFIVLAGVITLPQQSAVHGKCCRQ